MRKIVCWLIFCAVVLLGAFVLMATDQAPKVVADHSLITICILMGGLGGVTYCLRAVYLNFSVRKQWDDSWDIWYYLHPLVSLVCGGVSYLFLKAGLLVLEAKRVGDASDFGFMALAFIAGLNVDKFVAKIEDIAQAVWGIEQSRASKESRGADGH